MRSFLSNLIKTFEAETIRRKLSKSSKKGKGKKCPPTRTVFRNRKLEKLACSSHCPLGVATETVHQDGKVRRPKMSFRKGDPNEVDFTGPDGKPMKGLRKPCPKPDWENK